MNDTRKPEMIAESRLASELTARGILIAKPHFDQLGCDLLGFIEIDSKGFMCRIQSKYRDCTKRSQVDIPKEYIDKAFLLYLHMVVGERLHQAFLLPADIRRLFTDTRVRGKGVFRLKLSAKTAAELGAEPDVALTPNKVNAIRSLMKSSSALSEMHRSSVSLFAKAKEVVELDNRAAKLRELAHRARIATLQKEAADDHLATMRKLLALMDSNLTPEQLRILGLDE